MADRYSADEARRIFARAARRQHVAPAEDGLTLDELAEIGRSAGLDPALIRAEATSERVDDDPTTTWHGVPVGVRRSRLLPARLSDAEWERAVDLLRAEFKVSGTAEQIGRRREWATARSSATMSAAYRVRVEERPDGDLVTLEAPDTHRLMGMLMAGIFGGIGVFAGTLTLFLETANQSEGWTMASVFIGIGLVLYLGALLVAKGSAARTPDRFEALLDRIDLVSRLDEAPAAVGAAGRIDPSLLDPPDASESVASPSPRIRT